MDHKHLESFAREARQQLMREVDGRVSVILNTDSGLLRERPQAVEAVRRQAVDAKGRQRLVEEVAYTWFNRFCALRLLDVRGYHNLGTVSPAEGATQPQLLQDAKGGLYPEGLRPDDRARVQDLLSGRLSSHDPQGEAYRLLLRAVCNHLHGQMPFLFDEIDGPSELLLPEDLLSERSILERLRQALTHEACADVEVIGWLYQYYIAEKKDEIMGRKGAVPSEDVPARTQLFTPHWIVRYLVENSLGRLWLLNHPESQLAERMDYFLAPDPDQTESEFPSIEAPSELRVCDPACGSGHMLTYAFDLLYAIYEEQGYDSVEIPRLILRHNLTGIEIDRRAGQLAALALTCKARERDPRYLRRLARCTSEAERAELAPHIVVLEDVTLQPDEIAQYLQGIGRDLFTQPAERLLTQFQHASTYGSLIRPQTVDFQALDDRIQASAMPQDLFMRETHERVLRVLRMARALSPRYHVVVANPPYMGSGSMNAELKRFAKSQYPETKSDLCTMFVERNLAMAHPRGMVAMITMQSWMFLSSYKKMRHTLLSQHTLRDMAHLGARAFDSIGGEVVQTTALVVQRGATPDYRGAYLRLVDEGDEATKETAIREAIQNPDCGWLYRASAADFRKIPGAPIAYWVSDRVRAVFEEGVPLGEVSLPRFGMSVGDGKRFIRMWTEVSLSRSGFGHRSEDSFARSGATWSPLDKGGTFRKWYGNKTHVVYWPDRGQQIRSSKRAAVRSPELFFRAHISWTLVTSYGFSCRLFDVGYILDTASNCIYFTEDTSVRQILGFLNTTISRRLMGILNPTVNNSCGVVAKLPIKRLHGADSVVSQAVQIARQDWDAYETSWDFSQLPILAASRDHSGALAAGYASCRSDWQAMTAEMQRLEVENNRLFITAYGLQQELSPEVPLREITLTCNPHYRYPDSSRKSLTDDERQTRLRRDTAAELLSFGVGCLFGRYALEKPGLVLADQGATAADFRRLVPDAVFPPVEENVIPLLGDDWFADDLCALVQRWLAAAFGQDKLSANVAWLEEALGVDLERYLTRTFWRDHSKTYKKRPIYWLFASPKGSFQALIYLHRYREDTVSLVLNKLRDFRGKLAGQALRLQAIERDAAASNRERSRATKALNKLALIQAELADYERETLRPLATQQIALDLDDGVLVNYAKLGEAVKAI